MAQARSAGVRPIMITGDHPVTAAAIAAELGLLERGARALVGGQLQGMDAGTLRAAVRDVSVYARVAPEHKLRIVVQPGHRGTRLVRHPLRGRRVAIGRLLVIDSALPGGLLTSADGGRSFPHARTMGFTTPVFFSLFNTFNARFEDRSAFRTAPLASGDWLVCAAVASSVLWAMELKKLLTRLR